MLYATRTFFGVYRVSEDLAGRYHGLAHGTTLHGMQALAPARRGEPLTYFHADRSVRPGLARRSRARPAAREIAVVGLGVGTSRDLRAPGPAVDVLRDRSGDRADRPDARVLLVHGGVRRSLPRRRSATRACRSTTSRNAAYDLLVLDAFSSDSIPIHLMTREAVALYLSRLAPDGVLVMHISNRHLRLAPIVARLADEPGTGRAAADRVERRDWPEGKNRVALDRDGAHRGGSRRADHDGRWSPLVASASTPLWTDDFSNILSVLRVR